MANPWFLCRSAQKPRWKAKTLCPNSFSKESSLTGSGHWQWKPGTLPLTRNKNRRNYVTTDADGSKDRLRRQGQSRNSSNCLSAFSRKRKYYSKSNFFFFFKAQVERLFLPSRKDSITSSLNHEQQVTYIFNTFLVMPWFWRLFTLDRVLILFIYLVSFLNLEVPRSSENSDIPSQLRLLMH